MSGYDIIFLTVGIAAMLFACLFNGSKKRQATARKDNFLRKTDFRWLTLIVLLMQLPIWAGMTFNSIKHEDISIWGFIGVTLFFSAYGVTMGRSIEWGKQHGRPVDDSEKGSELSDPCEATNPEPS